MTVFVHPLSLPSPSIGGGAYVVQLHGRRLGIWSRRALERLAGELEAGGPYLDLHPADRAEIAAAIRSELAHPANRTNQLLVYRPGGAVCMVLGMHTHFGSATHLASTFLGVLLVGGLWRLAWMHGLSSPRPWVRGLAQAALFQY